MVKKKEFLVLESGGTGFSSHNKVDVKVYKPNENWIVCWRVVLGGKMWIGNKHCLMGVECR